jgi:preprotein translocase subunit SecB
LFPPIIHARADGQSYFANDTRDNARCSPEKGVFYMSDQVNGAEQANGQAAASPIVVLAQYIKDLSFENPNAPQSLMAGQPQPQVSVGVDVQAQAAGENIYEVSLEVRCEAKQEDAVAFIVELTYSGVFQLNGVPEEHVAPVVMIEGPRLLFPFARAIVADATRDGGYPPLMLAPFDFVDMFRRKAAAAQAQQQEAAASAPAETPF